MFYKVIITFKRKSNGEKANYVFSSSMRSDCENRAIRMIADSNILVTKVEFIEIE